MKFFLSSVSLCALISVTSHASAATPEQLAQAENLLAANHAQQALGLLESAHNAGTATTQEFFLLGMAAKLSGNLSKSERYFRNALAQAPSAGRIRLELAEVLYRQGKFDASRAELLTVRSLNPPDQVRQNIDQFIAQVDAAKANLNAQVPGAKKNWSAYVTVGLTYDSNVNAGPDTDSVFLFGLPFNLSANAQETQDTAYFVRTGFTHQAQLQGGTVWRSGAHLTVTKHADESVYDTTYLTASTGPTFPAGDKASVFFPITYNIQRYDDQESWFSQSLGLAPRLQYAVRENLQFYLDTSISRKRFNNQGQRDLTAYTFNPSINYQPHQNGNIAVGLQYGREDSGLDIFSSTVHGIYVGYQHVFPEHGLRASVTASYTDTQFDGVQAAFTEARHDVSKRISASVSYNIPNAKGLTLQGSVSYQDNDSNLDLNKYERTQVSMSLTKSF